MVGLKLGATVYADQPEGYIHLDFPNPVLLLLKPL